MSVHYVLIANGKIPLVIHRETQNPEVEQLARSALNEQIKPEQRSYFLFKSYTCYIKNTKGITFLVITDQSLEKTVSLGILDEITDRLFLRQTEQALRSMPANSMSSFEPEIKDSIAKCMSYTNKIKDVRREIEGTKEVMLSNVEKLIERDNKIDELVIQAEDMNDNAFDFKKSATNLKKQMKCQNKKSKFLIIGIASGAVVVIIIVLCVTLI